jgi:hypothetical protein
MIRPAVLALALAACSKPAPTIIDGSSSQSFARTVEEARRDLPDGDRLDFDRALAGVPSRRYGAPDPEAAARTTFDGMTGAEVVAQQRERQR